VDLPSGLQYAIMFVSVGLSLVIPEQVIVMSGVSPPGPGPDDDFDMAAEMARFLAEVDAGREPVPGPWQDGPAVMLCLGGPAGLDPAVLAAIGGPDGLDTTIFAQDGAADVLAPGPVLCALAEQAITGTLPPLTTRPHGDGAAPQVPTSWEWLIAAGNLFALRI
jgi:hypothetical protein